MSVRRYPSLEKLIASQLVHAKPKRRYSQRFTLLALLIAVSILAASGYILTNRNTVAHIASTSQVSSSMSAEQTIVKDIAYCHGNRLDLYLPRVEQFEKAPFVIYLHGGGWEKNDKQSEPNQLAMIDGLRDRGFAIASIDYRKLPQAPFPAAVQDALCAVRFLKAQAKTYELDKQRVALYGFSAGAHLASLVASLPPENQFKTDEFANESSEVQAVVTLAGIFNLHDLMQSATAHRVQRFMNGQDVALAEPASYINATTPPFLLLHGLSDQYILPAQDDYFSQILTANGVNHEQIRVAHAGHGLEPLTGPIRPTETDIKQRIQVFIRSQLLQ